MYLIDLLIRRHRDRANRERRLEEGHSNRLHGLAHLTLLTQLLKLQQGSSEPAFQLAVADLVRFVAFPNSLPKTKSS